MKQLSEIDDRIKETLQGEIKKALLLIAKNRHNYEAMWKDILQKKIIYQIIVLVLDCYFYHDLTLLLGINEESTKMENMITTKLNKIKTKI